MVWNDLLLNLNHDDEWLKSRLAEVFELKSKDIEVLDNVEHIGGEHKLTCIRNEIRGEFNTILHLYINFEISDDLKLLRKISSSLGCSILTSDDRDSSPYKMLYINASGETSSVKVDSNKLDFEGEYVISL